MSVHAPHPHPRPSALRVVLLSAAKKAGFELAGIASLDPSEHDAALDRWLAQSYHGTMHYLERPDAVARRRNPSLNLGVEGGGVSALVVGHVYFQPDPPGVPDDPSRGVLARYARGRDYHKVVPRGLRQVAQALEGAAPGIPWRIAVDTAPVLERELARRAGLGWFGQNTMLIHPRTGSYFFLGVLMVGAEVEPDAPFVRDHCGRCHACLDACPTGALLGRDEHGAPVMDARRCISYLTIENRGPIPEPLRRAMGNRVYGCDICQEACPFPTRFAEPACEPGYAARGPGEAPVGVEAVSAKTVPAEGLSIPLMGDVSQETSEAMAERHPAREAPHVSQETSGSPTHPGTDAPSLVALLEMALDPDAWESFSRGSAIRRAGREGFARNVCVAIGNWLAESPNPDLKALRVLRRASSDPSPLVREHGSWAMAQAKAQAKGQAKEQG
jgi:epoxyqueuosine reductase